MPHKKNPDVFEIIRGKCNRLQSIPNEVSLLTTNLPLGYQRDLQLLKDIIFPAIVDLKKCIDMTTFMVNNLQINKDILSDEKYDYLFTVEDVNRLVLNGMPFRDAYKTIGMQVQNKTYQPTREVHHTHQGSIGNLCTQQINNKMQQVYKQIKNP
jgi:argininosuccinate lyase